MVWEDFGATGRGALLAVLTFLSRLAAAVVMNTVARDRQSTLKLEVKPHPAWSDSIIY